MQFPDTARTCLDGYFLAEYVQIKVKTIIKRLNNAKRQTNYLVCNIEGTGIMSYGSYRTIQNYEVEYGVEKILKNVPEDHPSSKDGKGQMTAINDG